MALPFFYITGYNGEKNISLDEDTSRHVVQVLRMQNGEQLQLTDGKGALLTCTITNNNKKVCDVSVVNKSEIENRRSKITIAISLLKNTNRFEWFLEKATEIGVSQIIPLICKRTEKEKFRWDRMNGICISAMLQSQQCWLPVLHEPVQFESIKKWKSENGTNFIAHCEDGDKKSISQFSNTQSQDLLLCIGPEGDFTNDEISLALENNFIPVTLGQTRLRTETAGVVAATLLCHI